MPIAAQLPAINGIWYLATPYTKYPAGIWPAYKEAARIAGVLCGAGIDVYSPIAHSHPLAFYGDLNPLDMDLWLRVDAPFMAIAGGLIVAQMDGWVESRGVNHEITAFARADKPIRYLDPASFAVTEMAVAA